MSEIGEALNSSVALAVVGGMMAIRDWQSAQKAAAIGAALGHAFRAAELAYDLGQRHAAKARKPGNDS